MQPYKWSFLNWRCKTLKKTIKEIELTYGKPFTEVVKEMMNSGNSKSAITRILGLGHQSIIDRELMKEKIEPICNNVFKKGRGSLLKTKTAFKECTGFELDEYLFRLYNIEKKGVLEIACLLGASEKTIHKHLQILGIMRNRSEAQKNSIEMVRKDYTAIVQKSRLTSSRSMYESSGCDKRIYSAQMYARDQISTLLSQIVHSKNLFLEIIVGFNEWSVLYSKEVDIPIIVISKDTGEYKKYSIEYQGHYHDGKKDKDNFKAESLESGGWKHFQIVHRETDMQLEFSNIANDIITDFCSCLYQI